MNDSQPAEGIPVLSDGVAAPPAPPKIKVDVASRLSHLFGLNRRQSELDFVDVLVDADIPLSVGPFAFNSGDDSEPALAAAVAGDRCAIKRAGSN